MAVLKWLRRGRRAHKEWTDREIGRKHFPRITERIAGPPETELTSERLEEEKPMPRKKLKSMAREFIESTVRHNLTALGPLAVFVSDDMVVTFAAVVVSGGGLVWAWVDKIMRREEGDDEL